jgi:serine phosphatase RsbU (regulator of sigma subunit)
MVHALVESGLGAVVMLDGTGLVRLLNESARDLFPLLREDEALREPFVPEWLALAQYGRLPRAQGILGTRELTARRMPLPDGYTAWLLDDVTLEVSWQRRWQEERDRADFLAGASSRLLASLNWHQSVQAVAELAGGRMADAAVVVARSGARLTWLTSAVGGVLTAEQVLTEDVGDVPGLADALAGLVPVPSRWAASGAVPGWLLPKELGPPGPVLVTPMPGDGGTAGALVLLRRAGAPAFTEDEELFARVFAARAGAAVSAAALHADTAETTAALQRPLLPPVLRRSSGLDLAAAYRASRATDLIGGDFYDVHPGAGPGAETFLVLGDVCGKGTRAAVLTGKIRNTLAALRHLESDHGRLLELLNATLMEDGDGRFATMVLAGATPLGRGEVALRLTAAGHPPPLIVRADGTVEEAPTRGTLIGALPAVTTRTCRTVLRAGDVCLLYSDGVTEARGGPSGTEMFGDERLRSALADCAGLPVEAVISTLEELTAQWLGAREHDDIALLGIAAPRTAHPDTAGDTG